MPPELAGSEYVRNGSNPVTNADLGRDAHWFDGDGMLSGVSFTKQHNGELLPEFVNQYILTDVYLSTLGSPKLRSPILPSIATLVNPLASFIWVTIRIFRTLLLVLLSFLPGSKKSIKKISVANTALVYHDGRALATCESGPPMRISLPGLETVGWWTGGSTAEGEPAVVKKKGEVDLYLGKDGGLIQFMREWTTAHPKVDPVTKEMMMFHSSFAPPYVQYSILPQEALASEKAAQSETSKMVNAAVPGVKSAKMMHDFGVSHTHTVIMDLPLSLDPMNMLKNEPVVAYDSFKPSRFGVFPRRRPQDVTWFETAASCIFHTANTWNVAATDCGGQVQTVNMLACRLTSASLVFSAGNIAAPQPTKKTEAAVKSKRKISFFSKYGDHEDAIFERAPLLESPADEKEALLSLTSTENTLVEPMEVEDLIEEDQCRLYYYCFDLAEKQIVHQWALSALPFEFPSVRPDKEMEDAQFIYGCSTTTTSFGSALGRAVKIDALVKADATTLIARGLRNPPRSITGCVDTRNVEQIMASNDPQDPIKVFRMPEGWYAQEPRFVPAHTNTSEDDGWLMFYAFDESKYLDNEGEVVPGAKSELWIVSAKDLSTVVCRIALPRECRMAYMERGSPRTR